MTTDGPTPDPGVWVDPLPEPDEPDERDDDSQTIGPTDLPLAQNAYE